MLTLFYLFLLTVIGLFVFGIYKIITTSSFKADNDSFEQAGVKVIFSAHKVIIKSRPYDAKDITGLSILEESRLGCIVTIKVDDFSKPLHRIKMSNVNGNGTKFMQRFSTALRKAGGADFY